MRFFKYLASDRSNRLLLLIVIILVNLVSLSWYFRADLTEGDNYSLSAVSKQTVSSLGEPLTVSVFFSRDLPAPYNAVSRYLKDLLAEYDSIGNSNFRYQIVDVESDEGKDIADSYGMHSVQVQAIGSDEFQSRNVYMGLAVSYASSVEQLPEITGTEGLEYKITTTISRLVGTVGAAAALNDKVQTVLYYSPALADFNIKGFDQLESLAGEAVGEVNGENNGILKLEVRTVDSDAQAVSLMEQYGFPRLSYPDKDNSEKIREATIGLVLQLGDRFTTVPVDIARQIFGGYALTGVSDLDARVGEALEGLLNENPPVGYVTGHGERDLDDPQSGDAVFRTVNESLYEIREISLVEGNIPLEISTLVINGPKSAYAEKELYALDQFVMRGGSLVVFLDPYQVIDPRQMGQQGAPIYLPIDSGLTPLLAKYGIDVKQNYVLDKNSYKAQQQYGDIQLYHVPILKKESLNQEHPVTRNLGQVLFLSAAEVSVAENIPAETDVTVLASTSKQAWLMEGDKIDLNPTTMYPPYESGLKQYPLLVLAEGRFTSYFDAEPVSEEGEQPADDGVTATRYMERSIRRGKVLVAGTSEIAGPQLLDPEGRGPNAILMQNMLDYANGNEEMPLIRSKGLNLMPLGETAPGYRVFAKGFAMAGLPLLTILAGLVVWRLRERRRKVIQRQFSPGKEQ